MCLFCRLVDQRLWGEKGTHTHTHPQSQHVNDLNGIFIVCTANGQMKSNHLLYLTVASQLNENSNSGNLNWKCCRVIAIFCMSHKYQSIQWQYKSIPLFRFCANKIIMKSKCVFSRLIDTNILFADYDLLFQSILSFIIIQCESVYLLFSRDSPEL